MVIVLFGRILLPLLISTWRRIDEIPEGVLQEIRQNERVIVAFWHNRQIGLLHLSDLIKPLKVLVSRHGDGEIIARIVKRFGIGSVRGSSTRGGTSSLRQLVTEIHSSSVAITPDGPVGPRYTVKEGVIALAEITSRPIYWVSFGTDRAWIFDSWDRFILPKPFARVRYRAAGPFYVESSMTDEQRARAISELETEMRDQTGLLDEEAGAWVDPNLTT